MRLTGPDAVKCLENSTINNYSNFPVSKGRHIIAITPDGKMIGDGIAFKEGEQAFLLTAGSTLEEGQMIKTSGLEVTLEDVTEKLYNFHIQGPNSRKVIEALCGEDIGDLKFLCFRTIKISGRTVRLYRGGMSGELGYEFFGPSEDASVIWLAVTEAGREFGLRQLGYRSMMLNHLQAFFPTIGVYFLPSTLPKEANLHMFFRSPVDYGWGGLIDKNRDFPGKDILLEEMAHPKQKTMMLEWHPEDCLAIYASLFDHENEPLEQMPLPVNTSELASGAPLGLPVFNKENQLIGFATNRGYSCEFRKVLSITQLDINYTKPGTEVLVLYGSQGKRQMLVRAVVAEAPYKKDKRK